MSPETTIAQAKAWLRARLDDGEECPVCTQFAKVYQRRIHRTMARYLIAMYREAPGGSYVDVMRLAGKDSPDLVKTRYWGLLEAMPGEREDGSNRLGWWRLTDAGRAFVEGAITVPKYARLYDGRCLGFDGEGVTIRDALGARFNYDDLMRGL